MDITRMKEKEVVWIQIFYLFILPILLFYFGIIPARFRVIVFFSIALVLLGIIHHAKWTFEDMGIKKEWTKEWLPYAVFTLCGVLFLVWLARIVPHAPFLNWWENKRFLLLFIPLSVLQEVLFRGILMSMLTRAFNEKVLIIIINAAVFCMLHLIYSNAAFVLPLTFIGGIAFAWMYMEHKNLVLISIAHTIFNFTGMILGFFILR